MGGIEQPWIDSTDFFVRDGIVSHTNCPISGGQLCGSAVPLELIASEALHLYLGTLLSSLTAVPISLPL